MPLPNQNAMNGPSHLQWVPDVKRDYHDRIPSEQWESHRQAIIEHYLSSTLEETRVWMGLELDFYVS